LRIATAAAGSFWNTSDAKMLMLGWDSTRSFRSSETWNEPNLWRPRQHLNLKSMRKCAERQDFWNNEFN
jgi:neutral trehalase